MANSSGDKTAVILSGGGANGAYEVGVVKALFGGKSPATGYRPLNPDIFAGVSVGSYNAAVLVSHLGATVSTSAEYLEGLWIDTIPRDDHTAHNHVFRIRGDPLELLDSEFSLRRPVEPYVKLAQDAAFLGQDWFRRGVRFFFSSTGFGVRTLQLVDISTLFSREPFERLVKETISLEEIRRSNKVLRIAATNWKTGDLRVFGNKDMTDEIGHKTILASSAVPGIFSSVEISGDPYVDGGVVMNTPLKPAIDAGAGTLHVIYLDPEVRSIPLLRVPNTAEDIDRVFVIGFASTMNQDIEVAKRMNHGAAMLERLANGGDLSDLDMKSFTLTLSSAGRHLTESSPVRKLRIHRYHPHDDLGGVLGLLDFSRSRIIDLIESGFNDAINHDCAASGCVLPPINTI